MLIMSCSKSSVSDLTAQTPPKQPVTSTEVNMVSNWLSPLSFSDGVDRNGNQFITATYPFTPANHVSYNEDAHVELAYVRVPTNQRIPFRYNKLPFTITVGVNGTSKNVVVDYSLDPDGLKLYFKNAEYMFVAKAVDLLVSENWNFRYIIIPKSKYQSLNIDWDDLSAVAVALNFSL